MNLKTVLGWVAVAFVLWFIIAHPTAATHIVHNIGSFLTTGVHGISHFFASI